MFERFTEPSHQVVVLAQDEARTLRHNRLGTEHILLGLLREEEGPAARILESLDVTVEEVTLAQATVLGLGRPTVRQRGPASRVERHAVAAETGGDD